MGERGRKRKRRSRHQWGDNVSKEYLAILAYITVCDGDAEAYKAHCFARNRWLPELTEDREAVQRAVVDFINEKEQLAQ